ncbi:hypothetical protein ACFPRL_03890 [Pseudoclavibacter helvolus]
MLSCVGTASRGSSQRGEQLSPPFCPSSDHASARALTNRVISAPTDLTEPTVQIQRLGATSQLGSSASSSAVLVANMLFAALRGPS